MLSNLDKAKQDVLWGCKLMVEKGYALGTAGNISAKVENEPLVVITPTSVCYDNLAADDLVVVDLEGHVISGKYQPSCEVNMHLGILLSRPEVNAVVHTHSKCATAISAIDAIHKIPVLDIESMVYLGGELDVAPFAPPGSLDLAKNIKSTIGTSAGVIMANHGAIGVGVTMQDAMIASDNVERSCEMYLSVLATNMALRPLPEDYMENTRNRSLLRRKVVTG